MTNSYGNSARWSSRHSGRASSFPSVARSLLANLRATRRTLPTQQRRGAVDDM